MNHKLYKNPLVIILLILIIFIGLTTLFLFIKQSKQEIPQQSLPKPSLPPSAQQVRLQYAYAGTLPTFKDPVIIYNTNSQLALTPEKAQTMAGQFGFSQSPQVLKDISGDVYLFSTNGEELFIYPKPLRLEYRHTSNANTQKATQKELMDAGSVFLNQHLQIDPYSLGKAYLEYLKAAGNGMVAAQTLEEADYVQISYNLSLNNYPVVSKDRKDAPIILLLNADSSITKATITLLPQDLQSIGNAILASPDQALTAINAGQGTISLLNNPDEVYTEVDPRTVSFATLTSLELVYVYDFDSLTLQPYYRFFGNAKTTLGETLDVEILITALPQEVYKKQ